MDTLTREQIESALKRIGLGEGDIVLLHSSLASLGRVEGGADTVIQAFLNVLGHEGTLVVPTFGALGTITEIVRQRPDAVRSLHPKASVAALGAAAEAICRDHWKAETAHGADTPYQRIADMGGYVCLLGVDQDRNTTLHTVEELLRLPYLAPTPELTFDTPQGPVTKTWPLFPGPHRDFSGLDRALREAGKVRLSRIGTAVVRLMKSADLIETCLGLGRRNPDFVLCQNPACADCVAQRASLRRARYATASFRVAAAASLAGRYAEEMADACQATGITLLELDQLRGLPLAALPAPTLAQAVTTLRDRHVAVSALRLSGVGDAFPRLLATAADLDVRRLVMPLSDRAAHYAELALERGVQLSFVNRALMHGVVSDILLTLRGRGLPAALTFSPADFALVGEKPFLTSYRNRLRRFIDQVDVEDGLFDGTPAELAHGNGEIKEIVSILSACSFAGLLVLGPRNRCAGGLPAAVSAFDRLLDTI
jgi:aminoglycoside 3-N-acetyltransferase